MTWVRAVTIAGLLGGAVLGAGCNGSSDSAMQSEVTAMQAEVAAMKAAMVKDSTYMAQNAEYLNRMSIAICALEKVATPSPGALTLLCKPGGTEVKSPPVYPLP